ncbi:MAG: hypothetical protein WCQ50_10635 [Spirochaetota bacterium]
MGTKYKIGSNGSVLKFGFFPKAKTYTQYNYTLDANGNYTFDANGYYKYTTAVVPLHVTFALYKADSSSNYGYDSSWMQTTYYDGPGSLVAYTDSVAVNTDSGAMEIDLASASGTSITAGDYWIVANVDGWMSVSASSTYSERQSQTWATYGSAPPATFSANGGYVYPNFYQAFDFYLNIKP